MSKKEIPNAIGIQKAGRRPKKPKCDLSPELRPRQNGVKPWLSLNILMEGPQIACDSILSLEEQRASE